METQNSNPGSSANGNEDAATKNGGNATQEVSSTTPAVEITKRSLRVDTWRKMQNMKFGLHYRVVFNSIPRFVDSDKALALLVETEEFKKAHEIKVQIDRALYGAKMQTILAGKNLYLPSTRNSKALYLKVDVPTDADEKEKLEVLNAQNIEKHRTEIGLENKVPLDMIIIGAVLVSRDGYCIGRGNGYNDLDIGLLIEVGAITPKTIIATLVHDSQVVENLPTNLFQKYDAPVDLIITPTEIIRVEKRPPRPAGVFWELLSDRRLKVVGALQALKEKFEAEGKVITLKEEDTDVEQFQQKNRNRRRVMPRRRMGGRRFQRRTVSQTNNDQQSGADDDKQAPKRNASHIRRLPNRRRRPAKYEGEQTGGESKSQDRKSGSGGRRRQKYSERAPNNRDFSVKLTNITRDIRIKDLKSELRNRQCNPMGITWKGHHGHCYLHFGKRHGEPSTEEEINQVLEALNNLSLTITPENPENPENEDNVNATNGEGTDATAVAPVPVVINLKAELIKFADRANKGAAAANADADTDAPATNVNGADPAAGGDAGSARIESVDTTTV